MNKTRREKGYPHDEMINMKRVNYYLPDFADAVATADRNTSTIVNHNFKIDGVVMFGDDQLSQNRSSQLNRIFVEILVPRDLVETPIDDANNQNLGVLKAVHDSIYKNDRNFMEIFDHVNQFDFFIHFLTLLLATF